MTEQEIKSLQNRLNGLDYDAGDVDGRFGNRTKEAVKAFQRMNGLEADGIVGGNTRRALASPAAKRAHSDDPRVIDRSVSLAPPATPLPTAAYEWPHQRDCTKFYGQPGNPQCTAGKVKLPISFRLAWDVGKSVSVVNCHAKVADAFTEIWNLAVEHYGEAEFRRLGLDLFGGCYALRQMRGGSAWSMHSWGIAWDVDPSRNQLKWGRDRAVLARPEYLPFWNIVESRGALSLGRKANYDWMHFQFARL